MEEVSVIIPTYNRGQKLERAIKSVLRQTHRNLNLWVIDDGSSDLGVFKKFNDKRIFYVWTPNLGVSHARNLGVALSQSSWIAFLDSDDEWLPKKLEKQLLELADTGLPFIHCNEIWKKDNQILNQKKKHKKGGGRQFKRSVELCCISPSASLISRKLFKKLGGFREDFMVCEDYDLWLKLTSQTDISFIDEELLIKHGGHEDQLSAKYHSMDFWRIKALSGHLSSSFLSSEEKKFAKKIFEQKCEILIRGFQKHKRIKELKSLQEILNMNQIQVDERLQVMLKESHV